MQRLAFAFVAFGLTACGVDEDDRPKTLEYVTAAVLAPNCGNAQCHSSFRRAEDYAFDTIEETRITIQTYAGLVIAGDAESSLLYRVLVSDGGENQVPRMPYDQPMADKDVRLIYDWIDRGAAGVTP